MLAEGKTPSDPTTVVLPLLVVFVAARTPKKAAFFKIILFCNVGLVLF